MRFWVKNLLVNASHLVIMNETDPLILHTDASTVSVGGVLMQEQNLSGKTNHFHLSYLVGSRNAMGNYGAGVVCLHLLRQTTYSVSHGKTIYSEDGPQEPRLSREFVNSKVGPLESPTCEVQISHPAYPGRGKRRGRQTH